MSLFVYIKKHFSLFLLISVLLLALYATAVYLIYAQQGKDTVLTDLAVRFTQGKISLSIYKLPPRDYSNYFNNHYVYFGPLSSLMIMPFAFLFGERVPQVLLGLFSMSVSFISVYFIGLKFKFSKTDSMWLSVFFVFSSVLFASSVINITAYQVEALGVPFVLLALCAYFYKRHALLVGIFIACAVLTRFTLMGVVAFFFFELFFKRFTIKQFIILLIPIILAVGLLGAYNNRRFHSVLETGYNYNISKAADHIKYNHKFGELNLIHLPANLYTFLLMAPEPVFQKDNDGFVLQFPYLKSNPWGVAIWFTSPLFLFLIANFKKNKYTISAGITAVLLSIPVLFWYSIGYAQFGYRYALDFLPFLFLLLIPCLLPRLTKIAIALIVIGVLFNVLYSASMWDIYPLFNMYPAPM